MDGIQLEILWSNLISIVSDQAKALQRTAFSPVVRETGDLACAIFDLRGRMMAQARTGTPGHINSLANSGAALVKTFPPSQLDPGDVVITNDPWMSAGHFFDITIFNPVFHDNRIVAYVGSNIHHTDIGGYGVGAGARDIHEEGLWLPPLKFYERGRMNQTLKAIIQHNVRTPEQVFGDLAAQVASGKTCGERLALLCEREGLHDLEDLSDEIIARSEESTREAIRKLPAGTWHGESKFDVPGGEVVTLHAAVTIDNRTGEILIDFAGSSPKSPRGVNVVLNYTHAYSTFAVRSCLNPDLPNNYGSLAPIKIAAPKNCIVNAEYPSPLNARHVVGMYVPMPVLKALYNVVPDRVLAESAGAVWSLQIQGEGTRGQAHTSSMIGFSGGMGARRTKPGPSTTSYPTGVAAIPVEMIEATMPIEFIQRELRRGSGGAGQSPGGDGQTISFRMISGKPWLMNTMTSRTNHGAEGLDGGTAGEPGRFMVNGEVVSSSAKLLMQPDDVVTMNTPGGGGYGLPTERG
jgi:N-methylhydantoinase B